MRIHERGDLRYLYRSVDSDRLKGSVPDEKHWRVLYDQYLAEFGINDKYREYMEKRKEIALKQCDMVLTGDKTLATFIEIEQMELRDMINEKETMNFMEIIAALEKHLGFVLDPKRTTVMKYYTYLRAIERYGKD